RTSLGSGASRGHDDLARSERIRLWIRADTDLVVRPFTQSAGWIFRDAGAADVHIPGDGSIVALEIARASMADPSMVESIGLQVRPRAGSSGAILEVLAVTAVASGRPDAPGRLAVNMLDYPASVARYSMFTAAFSLGRTYNNSYDPAEIDVQVEFRLPSGR